MADPIAAWVASQFPGATFVKSGGQRSVYKTPGPPPAALKIWTVSDTAQHERHVREVSALGRLSHPGLPKIVSHLAQVEIKGQVFALYQEEWIDAATVGSLMPTLPADEPTFRAFMLSALDVLDVLHQEGIVHRDISLNNVLWDGQRARIIDLGLAKHLKLEDLTSTGDHLGMTHLTASPEQLQGVAADLRASTDVYSLGVIGFMFATGRHPFIDQGETIEISQLVTRQMNKDYRTSIPSFAGVLDEMLEPTHIFRPKARKAAELLA